MPTFARMLLALSLGAVFGALLANIGPTLAARSSGGTYSLAAGNPVATGTTISTTWANNTLSDIATELTDSLSRSGKGGMTAALKLANGTVAAPALSFTSDPDVGLYRIGANNPGMSASGVKVQEWTATGSVFPLTCQSTGTFTGLAGATITQTTDGGYGLAATANLTGTGGVFHGGQSDGVGISATGYGTGHGGVFQGGVTYGSGVAATGAGTGAGGIFYGGGDGGAGGGPGLVAASRGALRGDIELSGANPPSTSGFANAIVPTSIIKAWAVVDPPVGSAATILAGFNVTNPLESGNTVTVDFATDFYDTSYACSVSSMGSGATLVLNAVPGAKGTVTVQAYDMAGSVVNLGESGVRFSLICMGAQ